MLYVCVMNIDRLISDDIDRLISSLPFGDGEKKRLKLMKNSARQKQSLGALICLGKLLNKLNITGYEIMRTANGKPFFNSSNAPSFSLAHTGALCAAALADNNEQIGIDIELVGKPFDLESISRRFFTADERIYMATMGNSEEAFLNVWTAKEAYAKLTGESVFSLGDIPKQIHIQTCSLDTLQGQITLSIASFEKSDIKIFTEKDNI